ncbi:uncharacterized protein LOC111711636 [Eurytemora carolleeae]|uniref:uncharacterized protein LOC111711636 n=1 Tax=Eurytemora carolleeae TaxID=1294199 RepID=UPI000C759850|nr:uncharacterized protein LOC111711636 [Eurytemora carolleeae]|eukprot:XP_023341794.1 uncharacterized protein LOC111711636 [Eurytemora affinis]
MRAAGFLLFVLIGGTIGHLIQPPVSSEWDQEDREDLNLDKSPDVTKIRMQDLYGPILFGGRFGPHVSKSRDLSGSIRLIKMLVDMENMKNGRLDKVSSMYKKLAGISQAKRFETSTIWPNQADF